MTRIKYIPIMFILIIWSTTTSISQPLQTDFVVLLNKDTIFGNVKMSLANKKIKLDSKEKTIKLGTSEVLLCRNKDKIYYPVTYEDFDSNDLYKTEFMILEVTGFIKSFVAYRLSSSGQSYAFRFIKKDEDKIAKPFTTGYLLQITNNNSEVKKRLDAKKRHEITELEAILTDYNKSLVQN